VATVRTDDGVLGYVRALFRGAAVEGLGDAQLLELYRSRGDDEAVWDAPRRRQHGVDLALR
jgi:hypothetical protein